MKKNVNHWLALKRRTGQSALALLMSAAGSTMTGRKRYLIAVGVIRLASLVFARPLRRYYAAETAQDLAKRLMGCRQPDFIRRYLYCRMMNELIHRFLFIRPWASVLQFIQHNCRVVRQDDGEKLAKLLLFTHTGDYWLSIINAALQFTGKNITFVVPIFQPISNDMQKMYDKIVIPGVRVMFMNIHEQGALGRVARYLKREDYVVALFYDLSCYVAGIYNGAVEPVMFNHKKGHMTTGIVALAGRFAKVTQLVACRFSLTDKRYTVTFSAPLSLAEPERVAAAMTAFLEGYLKEAAWQWHFINNVDTYYHIPYARLMQRQQQQLVQYQRLIMKYSIGGGN